MSLIDDIRRDREEGTPGPWRIGIDSEVWVEGECDTWVTLGRDDYDAVALVVNEYIKTDAEVSINARRIARVPQMEAALLAAGKLAQAIEADKWQNAQTWAALTAFRTMLEGSE